MAKLLVQNKKMKKSSNKDVIVFNFGIPAFKSDTGLLTCPQAGKCAAGCYAKSGAYLWKPVRNAYENRLKATLSTNFVELVSAELLKIKVIKKIYVRIHDSGDFYSSEYYSKWDRIMRLFPNVQFYAYTKMVKMFNLYQKFEALPSNFTLIYSYGGKQDEAINENDRHSKVFESTEELESSGYVDVSHDDLLIFTTKKVGLVYHGVKSYKNTLWKNVGQVSKILTDEVA